MKTVIVTGAGGYIGSVLVPKLLTEGYKVKAIDRFFFGKDKIDPHPNLEIIKEDSRKLQKYLFENAYAVIDLVAVSNDPSGELYQEATYQINYESRKRSAELAKEMGVERYILPSSCSIYGFQDPTQLISEEAATNPLTTYAKANEMAEYSVLQLADTNFTVTVMRQATVYGLSPRMRFDLAINGMTYGAWKTKELPLMRDGSQWRPMVHVQDTTDVMLLLLQTNKSKINGEIFNVGSNSNNYQLKNLATEIKGVLPFPVKISWYGEADHRSYRVNFDKITSVLGWESKWYAADGAKEILQALENGETDKTEQTITLNWYNELEKSELLSDEYKMYGGILNIDEQG